jgi:hypothetical protein
MNRPEQKFKMDDFVCIKKDAIYLPKYKSSATKFKYLNIEQSFEEAKQKQIPLQIWFIKYNDKEGYRYSIHDEQQLRMSFYDVPEQNLKPVFTPETNKVFRDILKNV